MSFEKIDTDIKLPYDEKALLSGNPIEVAEYTLVLVETLQDLLRQAANAVNFVVSLSDGEAIYSKLPNADGTYPIGTWRLIQVGDNWERQVQLTLGAWTSAGDFERPE